jgi:hypothetical protein
MNVEIVVIPHDPYIKPAPEGTLASCLECHNQLLALQQGWAHAYNGSIPAIPKNQLPYCPYIHGAKLPDSLKIK